MIFAAALLAVLSIADVAAAQRPRYGSSHSFSFGYGVPHRSFHYSSGYPYHYGPRYYGRYGYGLGYGYTSPYGIYYNPGANYLDYYLPPIYAPAELAYGPQAMQRFVGPPAVDPFGGVPGGLPGRVAAAKIVEERRLDDKPAVRVSNIESRRRAGRFTELGDNLFRQQRYHEALQKYKSAAEAAPDVAETYFRQGHALTGTARYELAAAAFRRGLARGPEWATSAFRLESLYGDGRIAKQAHLENLASLVLANPGNADLVFVLAVFLHFDGDAERAARLFRRVADLSGHDEPHVRPFLPEGDLPAQPRKDPLAEAGAVDA